MVNCRKQIVLCLLLPSLFTSCTSIRCYECNSRNNTMCLDPSLYDTETLNKYLITTDCQRGVFSAHKKEFFCRKIIQTILHKNHDSEVRVTRGCGWVRHHKECYKADTEDHLETVCQCFQDDCNAATLPRGALLATAVAALSALAITF